MENGKSVVAKCQTACAAGINVPLYIRYLQEEKFDEALAVIREKIPFPAVCGYACFHPCELKCARRQYDEPIAIRLLKRAAVEHSLGKWADVNNIPLTNKRVAIIGSGPCGLTAAYYLAGMGHQVTIYEGQGKPGGMLRYGIPEYRLPEEVLDKEIATILARGIEIITDWKVTGPAELLTKGFDAVLVAIGAWQDLKLGIPGEEAAHIISGIAFLKEINSGEFPKVGKKVVVVGGGNTAIDAARAAVRLGAEVTILYRRTMEYMPANAEEIQGAIKEGIKIEFLAAPARIMNDEIVCQRMSLTKIENNRTVPTPIAGSEYAIKCDMVITAVGQKAETSNLHLDESTAGNIKIAAENLATGQNAVFAAGDAVTGPSSIIDAIAQGRLASRAIDKFLEGTGEIDRSDKKTAALTLSAVMPIGSKRAKTKFRSSGQEAKDFKLLECGYSKNTAVEEAQRCLGCDINKYKVDVNFPVCKGCGYCKEACTMEVFQAADSLNASGYKPMTAMATEKCVGCHKCLYTCPDFAIKIEKYI